MTMARSPKNIPPRPTLLAGAALTLVDEVMSRGKLLAANRSLPHNDFWTWHTEAANLLARACGDHTPEVESFQKIARYSNIYMPEHEVQRSRNLAMDSSLKALEATKRLLQAQLSQTTTTTSQFTTGTESMKNRTGVFISHSSKNKELVKDFVEGVLEAGIGVPAQDIFFISTADKGIPPGNYFIPYIRQKVRESAIVIAWITSEFFSSPFCMCELGAAWALLPDGEGFIPILDDVEFSELKAVLDGMQVLKANNKSNLNTLRDNMVRILGIPLRSTDRWEEQRDKFLHRLIVRSI